MHATMFCLCVCDGRLTSPMQRARVEGSRPGCASSILCTASAPDSIAARTAAAGMAGPRSMLAVPRPPLACTTLTWRADAAGTTSATSASSPTSTSSREAPAAAASTADAAPPAAMPRNTAALTSRG
jgi:hypothetical protein